MRLLFLSSFYPPYERGGFEQLCHEVATELKHRGHTVHILTSRYGEPLGDSSEPGVTRSLYLQADINYYQMSDFFLKRAAQERANKAALDQAIAELAPDWLVVWGMWNLSRNLPYWAEQQMPERVVYYLAATWPTDTDIHIEYWQLPARRRFSEVVKRPLRVLALAWLQRAGYPPKLEFKHVMCVSRFIYSTLIDAGQLPRSARVVYNGIDPVPFIEHARTATYSGTRPLRLLYFGTLVSSKGVHTAIEAMALLKEAGLIDRVKLTITGSGHPDYEAQLHDLADRLGLNDSIRFTGRLARSEVPAYLSQFDVYLFTSSGPEALARTVMEAMASGLLVIGAETGGQVEMLNHGQNALTFAAEDAAALADRIKTVLAHPELLEQLAAAGRQTVLERFTLRRMVDEVESYLTDLAHTPTGIH